MVFILHNSLELLFNQFILSVSGNHKSFFQIDSSSGQFRSAKRLDYDATPTVTVYNQLTLAVEDGNSHSVTTTVTVTLTDINDNTPICQPNAYFSTITESAASGVNLCGHERK